MTAKHNVPPEDQCQAAFDDIVGIASQDELERMMAAQIIAAHAFAMGCYREAAEASEAKARRDDLAVGDKLSRTCALLVASLRRHGRKARKTITVEYTRVQPDTLAPPKRAAQGAGPGKS